jgi:nucleoside-diphosphate-sugar epimerase
MTRRLLLTGGTGFLGGAIVARLLQEPDWPNTLLLVRAADANEGAERIRTVLAKYELSESELARIKPEQIVLGDFRDVDTIMSDARLTDVTHVINSAALASFANLPGLWPVNVDGTFAFAKRLHEVAKLQRFTHIGTAMCVGLQAPPPVDETYVPPPDLQHMVPYTETKVVIEEKLRTLPGFPLVVARPTIVVGHTKLGTKPSGSIFWVFRTAQRLGAFTCALTDRIDVVPVDWVADATVALTYKPKVAHTLYHLSCGPKFASTFAELDIAMARGRGIEPLGETYRQASFEELAAMRSQYVEKLGRCNPRIMQRAIRLYGIFAASNLTFSNERLLAEGIAPPPPFAHYADICARTSEGELIADQMVADFK